MGYYYGIDIYYLLLVVPAILISLAAQIKVKASFAKYSRITSSTTGAVAAEKLLKANGVSGVKIERVAGNLTDHYDPRTNTIRLSEGVYDSMSIAAVGVACHEAGHAVQYAVGYAPIKLRMAIIPITNIGSTLSWPILILGLIFNFPKLIFAGIALFGLVVLFQLVTLPVEFNASSRALKTIRECYILSDEEQIRGAKSMLSAAAMTYVAALLVSLAQLLRLLLIFGKNRDR